MKPAFARSLGLLGLCLLFSSCTNKPVAEFIFKNGVSATAGDQVEFINFSVHATDYIWTMPDGSTQTGVSPAYTIPVTQGDANLTFTLTANSAEGKNEYSKDLPVAAARGNVIFWHLNGTGYSSAVINFDSRIDSIPMSIGSAPDCTSDDGARFIGTKVGTHNYSATDGVKNWDGTVDVSRDGCTVVLLN